MAGPENAVQRGYVSMVTNPLATDDEVSQHFLLAGPGHQACQDQ